MKRKNLLFYLEANLNIKKSFFSDWFSLNLALVANPQCLGPVSISVLSSVSNVLLSVGAVLTTELAIPQTKDHLQLQRLNLDLSSRELYLIFSQASFRSFSTASFLRFLMQHFISQPNVVRPNWTPCIVSVPTCSPPVRAPDQHRHNAPSHCGVAMPTGGGRIVGGWLLTFLQRWKAHLESRPGGRAWLTALCLQEIRAEGSQGARLHNVSSFLSPVAERRFSTQVLTLEILQDCWSGGEIACVLQKKDSVCQV